MDSQTASMLHPTKIRTLSWPLCYQTTMAIHATIYMNIRRDIVPDSWPEKWRVTTLKTCTKLDFVCFFPGNLRSSRRGIANLYKIKCNSYGNTLISQQIIHHSRFSHQTENSTWSDWFYWQQYTHKILKRPISKLLRQNCFLQCLEITSAMLRASEVT